VTARSARPPTRAWTSGRTRARWFARRRGPDGASVPTAAATARRAPPGLAIPDMIASTTT
jgi:hypothetical protein